MRRPITLPLLALGLVAGGSAEGADGKTDLIPREILFGNPDKAGPRISPDGKYISYVAPVDGVLNVWVGPADKPAEARAVTKDKKRGIRSHFWSYNSTHVLYVQDNDGDEDFHVYAVNLKDDKTTDLTPLKNVRAQILGASPKFPDEILVGLNDRKPEFHDVYRVNVTTGKRELLQKNDGYMGFVADDDYRIRFAQKFADDGGTLLFEPDGKGGFKEFLKVGQEDSLTTAPAGFDKTGNVLYLIDSRGRDTSALTTYDLKTNKQAVVAQSDKADVGGVLTHPTEHTIQAVSFTYDRTKWEFKDDAVAADFKELAKLADGEISISSQTLDNKQWVVAFTMDVGPTRYYHYDRATKKARFLFTNRKDLEGLPLQKMHPVVIKARDGLDLVCYYTLPIGSAKDGATRPDKPVPMVLDVHGGPWARDEWGYNPEHQFLANRGYAVLSINYRGSTGFGKKFLNSSNKEWAGKMHEDLLDAVEWAVKEKIAARDKVAIMGGSYGGYATLVGLTFTPDVFACGVDIVGPSNLVTLLNTIPAYWAPAIQLFKDRVGDHTTDEGKKLLEARSPLNRVDKIKKPLLIGQGANDPRVKQSESDQIVAAMKAKQIPVTYVLFPDEGHGFARPANRLAFYAVTEAFLAKQLGGRAEPIGTAFKGSTIKVPSGANDIPGLEEALPKDTEPKPKN